LCSSSLHPRGRRRLAAPLLRASADKSSLRSDEYQTEVLFGYEHGQRSSCDHPCSSSGGRQIPERGRQRIRISVDPTPRARQMVARSGCGTPGPGVRNQQGDPPWARADDSAPVDPAADSHVRSQAGSPARPVHSREQVAQNLPAWPGASSTQRVAATSRGGRSKLRSRCSRCEVGNARPPVLRPLRAERLRAPAGDPHPSSPRPVIDG